MLPARGSRIEVDEDAPPAGAPDISGRDVSGSADAVDGAPLSPPRPRAAAGNRTRAAQVLWHRPRTLTAGGNYGYKDELKVRQRRTYTRSVAGRFSQFCGAWLGGVRFSSRRPAAVPVVDRNQTGLSILVHQLANRYPSW